MITKSLNVPVSLREVEKVVDPFGVPFTIAVTVPANPLYAFSAIVVSSVPLVYLLAVFVSKSSPAVNGDVALLSVKLYANFGSVPCAGSTSEIVLFPSPSGAVGTA